MQKILLDGEPVPKVPIQTLLTYADLSQILKRSEHALRRDVMHRRIPFKRIGGQVRFDPQEIKEWIEKQSVPAVACQ